MDAILNTINQLSTSEITRRIQRAGVAGAGGAGFPSYVKWGSLDSVDYLLVNHQESEPNYYADKRLVREHPSVFSDFFQALADTVIDGVVIGTKEKYRDEWIKSLEDSCAPTVFLSDDLPADQSQLESVNLVFTPDVYTYSEESVLLMVTVGQQIGDDLPTDHGWIVHNTESIYNIIRAVIDQKPVTRKYVHVDGNTPQHRCLDVPIGTPASTLLEAAGREDGLLAENESMADGGPGWCYEITQSPSEFGVRKRTNGLLVLDTDIVRKNEEEDGQIDVLQELAWDREHETAPQTIDPSLVRIPLISNQAYSGFVAPSVPVCNEGDEVTIGEVIAEPAPDSISNTQHASIDGEVTSITDTHITLQR